MADTNFGELKSMLKSGFIFKIVYLLLVLLSFNSLTANSTQLTYFSFLLTAFGGIYFIYRLLHYGAFVRTKGLLVLTLFLLSYVFSAVYSRHYGFLDNVKALIWMGMQFFLLYACDSRLSRSQIKRECKTLGWFFVIYTFVFSSLGIACVILNYSQIRFVNDVRTIIGYLWNRLWGLYSDPNYGAIFALLSTIISIFFIVAVKKTSTRIFFVVNSIIQLTYIAWSDSRTAQVALIISSFVLVIMFAGKLKFVANLKNVSKVFVTGLMAIVVAVLPMLFINGMLFLGNEYLTTVSDPDSPLFYWMDANKRKAYYELLESGNEEDLKNLIGRSLNDLGDDGGDISNRRFAIWKSALEVVKTSPVLGVSFRNIVPYTEKNLPHTYIVDNDHGAFASMHNVFVDVLVSQGVLGFVIFLIFIVVILSGIFGRIFKKGNQDYILEAELLCVIVPIAASALVYSEIMYINTGGAAIFWIALGYMMNLLGKNPEKGEDSVGILTFHNARNYGANLQALALQTKIESLGKDAVIINYNPKYVEDSFGLIVPDLLRKRGKGVVSFIKFWISTLLHLPWRVVRESKFRLFGDKYYNLSDNTYLDASELIADTSAPSQNTFIFGSDQIWNNNLTHGFDGAFFGEGFSENSYRASYAASLGNATTEGNEGKVLKEKLKFLDCIAVREESAIERLSNYTDRDIALTVDPTLLLDRSEWERLCRPVSPQGDYICVYVLEINDALTSFVNQLATKERLPVVIFDLKNRYGCKAHSRYTADPLEFISYIKHAKFVVTNSFHGTIFSIIFKKQFVTIPNTSARGRAEQLLLNLELTDRLTEDCSDLSIMYRPIDFDKAYVKMEHDRRESVEYLKAVLEN